MARLPYPALVPLLLLLASCSPRYSLHEVSASGFEVEGEAFVATEEGLTFAYDFWGAEGAPFVSIYNETADTILLELEGSTVRASGTRALTLGEVLAGESRSVVEISLNYPTLLLCYRPPALVLAPGRWSEFYGVPQVSRAFYGGNGQRSECVYAYRLLDAAGAPATVTHVFSDRVYARLRRHAFEDERAGVPRPNVYFLDRAPQRARIATEVVVALGNVMWLL